MKTKSFLLLLYSNLFYASDGKTITNESFLDLLFTGDPLAYLLLDEKQGKQDPFFSDPNLSKYLEELANEIELKTEKKKRKIPK